jgi:hypothetical protein
MFDDIFRLGEGMKKQKSDERTERENERERKKTKNIHSIVHVGVGSRREACVCGGVMVRY